MKKILPCMVAALFMFSPLLSSCTKSEERETEKGAINRMTEKTGKEMAERMTSPLEQARNAKELVEENYRDMEEDVKRE